jgi:DNA (cytosine-5)-methyltransferase 1
MHTCPTCLKEFAQKGHLTAHLNRKKKCEPSALVIRLTSLEAEVKELRNVVVMPTEVTAISLFSGAGGDTLGLERANIKVVAFNEFNEAATKTHMTVFPSSVNIVHPETKDSNIRNVPDSAFESYKNKVQLIMAGFPCQGMSHAGKKRVDDKRNELVHEFVRVTKIVQPEWIIGENVKGLLSRKGRLNPEAPLRPVIEIIRDLFDSIGYRITYQVIDVSMIGVPQNRKRLIIIGHRGTTFPHVPWNSLTDASTLPTTSIRSFLESHLEDAMELPALYKPQDQPAHYWISTTETAVKGTPHKNLDRLVRGLRNLSSAEKESNPTLTNPIIEPEGLISFGVRKGGYHGMVVNPDVPCNTIISTYNLCPRLFVGLYNPTIHKYWIRCMTSKELGQIQGFPATYQWQGTEKEKIIQIGNAVPPPLAERIGRTILAGRVELKETVQGLETTTEAVTGATADDDDE